MAGEQPVPDATRCPDCGGEPLDARHNLTALGYRHDHQRLSCAECGASWHLGVPDGEADEYFHRDLACASCGEWGRVHRVLPAGERKVGMQLKCPECYYMWSIRRVVGDADAALVGWPMTTGELGDGGGWSVGGAIRPHEVDSWDEPEPRRSVSESATVSAGYVEQVAVDDRAEVDDG